MNTRVVLLGVIVFTTLLMTYAAQPPHHGAESVRLCHSEKRMYVWKGVDYHISGEIFVPCKWLDEDARA